MYIFATGHAEIIKAFFRTLQNHLFYIGHPSFRETEAQFTVPDWGDKVDYGIGLSHSHAT